MVRTTPSELHSVCRCCARLRRMRRASTAGRASLGPGRDVRGGDHSATGAFAWRAAGGSGASRASDRGAASRSSSPSTRSCAVEQRLVCPSRRRLLLARDDVWPRMITGGHAGSHMASARASERACTRRRTGTPSSSCSNEPRFPMMGSPAARRSTRCWPIRERCTPRTAARARESLRTRRWRTSECGSGGSCPGGSVPLRRHRPSHAALTRPARASRGFGPATGSGSVRACLERARSQVPVW